MSLLLLGKLLLWMLLLLYISPQMHTYEISLGFCVYAVFFVQCVVTYFVYSLWLLCLLSSASLSCGSFLECFTELDWSFLFIMRFCRYLSFISCIILNIGLWVSMYVSFICNHLNWHATHSNRTWVTCS
jgi:hypothetical protein